jgi:hypothetical protein
MLETTLIQHIANLALQAVAIQWKAQGHNLTGNAIQQLETRIVEAGGGVVIQGYIVDYMAELNEGTKAKDIPKRGTSEYDRLIVKLSDYARKRGMQGKRTYEQIAQAIVSRWYKEGKPTKASARFSSTGKRTGFIEAALDGVEPELAQLIERGVEESINFVLESFFKSQIGR